MNITYRLAALLCQKIQTQSGRNATLSAGAAILNPLLQIAATPIFFRELGPTAFGIWVIVNATLATSGIATLGLGEAAIKFIALNHAEGHSNRVIQTIRTSLFCYLALGFAAACAVFAIAEPLARDVFKLGAPTLEAGILAFRIAAAGLVVRFLYAVMEAALRGLGRYDLEAVWSACSSSGATIAGLAVVLQGGGVADILIAGVTVSAITIAGMLVTLRGLLYCWHFAMPAFHRKALEPMIRFGIFTWLQTINNIILHQLDRIVVGAFLGVAAAGMYSICLQLIQTSHMILARASGFIFPLAVKSHATGKKRILWDLFRNSMSLLSVLGWALTGGLFVFAELILTLWMGAEFAATAAPSLRLLSVWGSLLATSIAPFYFLNATGQEKLNTIFAWTSGPVFAAFALPLIPLFGAFGAAASRVASAIVTLLITRTFLFRRVFGDSRWFAGPSTLLPTLGGVIVALGGATLSQSLPLAYALAIQVPTYLLSVAVCSIISHQLYQRIFSPFPRNSHNSPPNLEITRPDTHS